MFYQTLAAQRKSRGITMPRDPRIRRLNPRILWALDE